MSKRGWALLVAVAAALMTGPISWAQDDDILDNVINSPPVQSWRINGLRSTPRPVRAEGVLGEQAVRVRVTEASDQPWTVSGDMAISGDINRGDTILLAVWARTHTPPQGQSHGVVSGLRVQQSAAPYDAIIQDSAAVPGEWTMIYASGVAQQDYPGGTANVSVHLAGAAQTIDLGPAFVLNLGPDYDASQLPRNPPPQ